MDYQDTWRPAKAVPVSGKGSKRRPAAVSDSVVADNWARIFGKKRPSKKLGQSGSVVGQP